MRLRHLSLRSFRNYSTLELDVPPGLSIFCGANAQGKTNLLEAVALLSLTKSPLAESDREVVPLAAHGAGGFTRVEGLFQRKGGTEVRVGVDLLWPPTQGLGTPPTGPQGLRKRISVNHLPRGATEAVGTINAVLFTANDLQLVKGPPAERRRFLDTLISQMDRPYLRSLQRYQKVLAQRNHLLRLLAESKASPDELIFWDDQLCAEGAAIMVRRQQAVGDLAGFLAARYQELSPQGHPLRLAYQPTVPTAEGRHAQAAALRERLEAGRHREIAFGQTLVGPHRDELAFSLGDMDVGTYGSRGQARLVALALRLAEACLLTHERGESPILLLDDVLSELDGPHRQQVLRAAREAEQTLLTLTDAEAIGALDLPPAQRFRVEAGAVTPDAQLGADMA
ncbi:MAG: DNA replication/repair protein RecF [Chloroflexi bacterium]|nr:DNA replication/repair protein RecF [Chloroflexota bacterium]